MLQSFYSNMIFATEQFCRQIQSRRNIRARSSSEHYHIYDLASPSTHLYFISDHKSLAASRISSTKKALYKRIRQSSLPQTARVQARSSQYPPTLPRTANKSPTTAKSSISSDRQSTSRCHRNYISKLWRNLSAMSGLCRQPSELKRVTRLAISANFTC